MGVGGYCVKVDVRDDVICWVEEDIDKSDKKRDEKISEVSAVIDVLELEKRLPMVVRMIKEIEEVVDGGGAKRACGTVDIVRAVVDCVK